MSNFIIYLHKVHEHRKHHIKRALVKNHFCKYTEMSMKVLRYCAQLRCYEP
jgi:hypothetical protein